METEIQKAICDYLSLRGHFFYRSNNVPVFEKSRNVYRKLPKYTPSGIPDIIVVKGGMYIGLEVKTKTGKQSIGQKMFQKSLEEAGGIYYIVRSIEDVQAIGL